MAFFLKGKIFTLLLLFILSALSCSCLLVICYSPAETCPLKPLPIKHYDEYDRLVLLDQQESQLKKLEILVENFRETLSRLESSVSECCKFRSVEKTGQKLVSNSHLTVENVNRGVDYSETELRNCEDHVFVSDEFDGSAWKEENGVKGMIIRDSDRGKGITVTKYKPLWSERFRFLSAVKIESEVTCISILPYEDYEGFSKYIAVGDELGKVYVFSSSGDVLLEFHTLSNSSVTSILSYMSVVRNEGFLVTGHRNGAIFVHRVWEAASGVAFSGEDWHILSMEHSRTLVNGEASNGLKEEEGSSIEILEVHQVGRIRYILGSDSRGKIQIFRENGSYYGTAISPSRPLAFLKQRLLFLTESGAASLDLRTMSIRKAECEGLNGSLAKYYVFDVSERSKAFGFTSEGDLIHVVLLGDILNFKCRVRAKKKSDMDGPPLAFQAIKGYLLFANHEKVFVYNISSHHTIRGTVPRPLFFATLDEIKSAFLNSQMPVQAAGRPLIAGNREKLVVLGLGGGYVGVYQSNLPLFKTEFNTVFWSSPVLLFVLFLIAAWQFFGKTKEVLTSADYPFSTAAAGRGASLGTGTGDRAYTDSSRADIRELRPSRRYASPSHYPAGQPGYAGGAAISFRSSSADPGFRTAPELNFRPPNVEPAGLPKRREPLFQNNQVVEDEIH